MTTTLGVLTYLALGALAAGMGAQFYAYAYRGRAWQASVLSSLLAALNLFVLATLLARADWMGAAGYILGDGIGTYIVVNSGRHG